MKHDVVDADSMRTRLTSRGVQTVIASILAIAVGVGFAQTACIIVGLFLGTWTAVEWSRCGFHLRRLAISRSLPSRVFAEAPFRVLYSVSESPLEICIVDDTCGVDLHLLPSDPRLAQRYARFSQRGHHVFSGFRAQVRSGFGLAYGEIQVASHQTTLVYPRPEHAPRPGRMATPSNDPFADFQLRAYRTGDPMHRIHWPTSLRAGSLHRVDWSPTIAQHIIPSVSADDDLERTLSLACGQLLAAANDGQAIGLQLFGRVWPARRGEQHLHLLLGELARADAGDA